MVTVNELQERIEFVTNLNTSISKRSSSCIIIEVNKGDDRTEILQSVAAEIGGTYVPASKLRGSARSSRGGVIFEKFSIIAKEMTNGKSLHSIDARSFIIDVDKTTRFYDGNAISCFVFEDYKSLEKSIIKGCYREPLFKEEVATVFDKFFQVGKFDWGQIPRDKQFKIGVYVAELLSGWALLKGDQSKYIFGAVPFSKRADRFFVPDDPSLPIVDSFIEVENKSFSISNKFAKGSPASLFASVVPSLIKKKEPLRFNSAIKELVDICVRREIKPKGNVRKIIYEWGINSFLKMNIKNPESIYEAILTDKLTPDHHIILEQAGSRMKESGDVDRYNLLPYSLSSFFNNELTKKLNSNSLDTITQMVIAKNFYQFNLDKPRFIKGALLFKSTKPSAESRIRIIGNKAAKDDITCTQGWINYEIKSA
jgi:hypothetical protein